MRNLSGGTDRMLITPHLIAVADYGYGFLKETIRL
jgi:hypothetical protein